MQCRINSAEPQRLETDWFGQSVCPPWLFHFSTEGDELIFRVSREGVARVKPAAQPLCFTADLWKYDTAEFFIATADARRYAEFNLAPNGAWWAAVFNAPRVPDPYFGVPEGISAHAEQTPQGWRAELRVPLTALAAMGMSPEHCRLATAAIVSHDDGSYTFLTTGEHDNGKPDFHRPETWPAALY